MKLSCAIRGYCNKFTKSIMAAGVLLLATGLIFCDWDSLMQESECGNSAQATVVDEQPEQKISKERSVDAPRQERRRSGPTIRSQQRQMQERLQRLNQKIERLKTKRRNIKENVK